MAKLTTPYLQWRDGRPRWVPSPELRRQGHKGRDLKYPDGRWMSELDAHQAARAINAGRATPTLPQPAGPAAPYRTEARSMAALFRRLQASPKFQAAATPREVAEQGPVRPGMERLRLAANTLHGYNYHMQRLKLWCGDILVADMTADEIEFFYHEQAEAHGLTSTTAMMRTLKMAMNYAVKRLRWIDFNPVLGVKLIQADGRCVVWEEDEIAAIIAAADWCGLPSIGDAFVLGVLTGQRQQDILVMPEGELGAGHFLVRQKKRGATAFVPRTLPLQTRLQAMRERKAKTWPDLHHTLELVNSANGKPYHTNAKEFGEQWRKVRAIAAGEAWAVGWARQARPGLCDALPFAPVAGCARKLFMDTRDTAVTFLFMAGCNIAEIANITGHSLKTVQMILDKHYFTRNAGLATSAGVKLDAHLETLKIRWA